jgi:hypothetical protein
MNNDNKKDNVIGIGHNQNNYSKEQYAKLLKAMHKALLFTKYTAAEITHLFDEAFTKHENGRAYGVKLKDFEVHERRSHAKRLSANCQDDLKARLDIVENTAKNNNIQLEYDRNLNEIE